MASKSPPSCFPEHESLGKQAPCSLGIPPILLQRFSSQLLESSSFSSVHVRSLRKSGPCQPPLCDSPVVLAKNAEFPPPPETACFGRWCWYAWKLLKHCYSLGAAVCALSYLLAPQRRRKTSVHHSVHNKPEHNFDYLIPTRLRWDGFILSHWKVSSVRSLIVLPQHFVCFSQAAVLSSFPLFRLLQPNHDAQRRKTVRKHLHDPERLSLFYWTFAVHRETLVVCFSISFIYFSHALQTAGS